MATVQKNTNRYFKQFSLFPSSDPSFKLTGDPMVNYHTAYEQKTHEREWFGRKYWYPYYTAMCDICLKSHIAVYKRVPFIDSGPVCLVLGAMFDRVIISIRYKWYEWICRGGF